MKHTTLLALAIAAIIIFYLVSDPFQARVDQAVHQKTQWTPQNIQQNPGQYLFYSRNEAKQARDSLSASLIDLAQQRARFQSQFITNETELDSLKRLLPVLVKSYQESEDNGHWPATIGENLLTESELRERILEADGRYQRAVQNSERFSRQLGQLSSREEQVRKKIREVNLVIARIDSASEDLETQAALDSVERIDRDLSAIVGVVQVLDELSRDPGSLDALIEQQAVTEDNVRFREILDRQL